MSKGIMIIGPSGSGKTQNMWKVKLKRNYAFKFAFLKK
jgi:ribose 1,5-bisphosphokinase PhnN